MPLTRDQALARVDALYQRLSGRRNEIDKLERAFRGDQPLAYASKEWKHEHAARYADFSDNWCGVVGSAPGERTEVFGFRLGTDTDPLSSDEALLWRDWTINEGPAQSSQGFLTSTVAKRSAVLVWGNEDDEPEMTWEHPSQVIVGYTPGGRQPVDALKAWLDGDEEYATLYTADEVWKFKRKSVAGAAVTNGRTEAGLYVPSSAQSWTAGGWEPRQPDGDDSWPLENPMGVVPVVEFRNRPMLGGEPLSDIAGTMAMQNAINLLWAYLFVAADFASMPARVVMGQEPPKVPILNEDGQKIGEKAVDIAELTRGRMLWLTGQTTKVGQWDAAKLDVFTGVINVAVRHVAAQTRTPIYLVHGELGNVNGETLTALDVPLVSKVEESHKFYTSPVREVFRRFALVRGDKALAESCRVGLVQWRDAAIHSTAALSDAALKDKQVGWPFAAILERRYGLSQTEIARIIAMRDAEAADPTLEAIARDLTGGSGAPAVDG